MDLNRRQLLAGLAVMLAPLPRIAGAAPTVTAAGSGLYVSARAKGDSRRFRASVFTADGRGIADLPLPARGHGAAHRPETMEAVLFGRRPGRYALVFDMTGKAASRFIEAAAGRLFAGHGVFAPDGSLLYATENNYEAGCGVLGIYDCASGYARVGELPSHGVGPHQLLMLPDGHTLAVCNGGIRTHPDFPRAKLNLATMRPSLAYIDRHKGRLVAEARWPDDRHQLSIRHLDVAADGTVAFGMQYQGPKGDAMPLVALHRGEGALVPLAMPEAVRIGLRQYIGSVAFDAEGEVVAATSPVGNRLVLWKAGGAGRYLGDLHLPDVCGVAPAEVPGRFVATSGTGAVYRIDAAALRAERCADPFAGRIRWDNHLLRV